MKTTYKSTGYVLGNYWGGGKGSYPATTLYNESKKELIKEAEQLLKNGGLDSGMGYESLIGAILYIDTIRETEIDGRVFVNVSTEEELIGEMTLEEEEFLFDLND